MALHQCSELLGSYAIIETDPDILHMRNLIYSPGNAAGQPWGIYDHGGAAVMAARFWQGGVVPTSPGQEFITPLSYSAVRQPLTRQAYIYVGLFHAHYGHFLLSTFSRFWPLHLIRDTRYKLLFHSHGNHIDHWFAQPHIAALFGAIGLTPDRFVQFDHSVRLDEVLIPYPAFQETGYGHIAFARSCNEIGAKLAASHLDAKLADTPIYLSKSRLPKGVGCIDNEAKFTEVLERGGVTIVYPETLSFGEQIALFYNHLVIAGQTGSALHTSIFAPGRKIIGLCHNGRNFSSYAIIDGINQARGYYVFPSDGDMEQRPGSQEFPNVFHLADPVRTGQEFLHVIDRTRSTRKPLI